MSTENLNRASVIPTPKRINAGVLKLKVVTRLKKRNIQTKLITVGIFLSIGILSYLAG